MAEDSKQETAAPRADITGAEVDALLVKNTPPPPGTPQPYDLVARDRIVRGRMPVLDRLNERWVTEFERKLGELIRQPLEVNLQEVQLAPFGNWLAALPVPTSFNLYTVKPWPRNALVAVDGKLLFTLVNSYYGGSRPTPKAARETLTPTEQRLNKIVIDMLVELFRRAVARRDARFPARAERGQRELPEHGDAERDRRRHARRSDVEGAGWLDLPVAAVVVVRARARQARRRPEDRVARDSPALA